MRFFIFIFLLFFINQYELELANGNLKGVHNETLEMLKKMHYNNAKENNNWIELYP